ncbi:MAG: EAL domain-containing protein [Pseudomonadota bacterium]|nr:MAG: EAL domain-containing protein [Pseudomonadota bacterium]
MNDEQNLIRLLSVFDASEEAEALCNVLRNTGYIVRDLRVEDEEDMRTALDEESFDIVLAKAEMPDFRPAQVAAVLGHVNQPIPVVAILPAGTKTPPLDLLKTGVNDAVSMDQSAHLSHIVRREVEHMQNLRALRRCERMLHETEKRARTLIDGSRDAIAFVHDGMHIYANGAYLKMFELEDFEDIEGMPIMDMVSSDDSAKFKDFLRGYAKGQIKDNSLEVQGTTGSGKTFSINMEFSPASMDGESCTQIIIRDQTLSKDLEQKLHVLSQQDILTGLYNRSYFTEQLEALVSRAVQGSSRGALLYINLDGYERIKDEHGISGSDLLLSDVGQLLKSKLDEMGLLARFDGPVFTLMLQNVDIKNVEKLADGICRLVNDHISDVGNQSVTTTASIGISLINETSKDAEDAISRAAKGCQSAEQEGGNRFSVYNPAIEDLAENEQLRLWASRIKTALQKNQFRLMFQPVISLHGEPGEHYEVLVRMIGEDGEEIPPNEFVPSAEQAGLMGFVDRWVIANSLIILSERHKQNQGLRFFIKLSSGSLTDEGFLTWLNERIKSLRLDANTLVFQVSENTALNYMKQAKVIFDGLRQLRCRCAVENFGKEQNTFQSLKHLDVDYIKIHRDLIANLAKSVENQEKVKAIAEHAGGKDKQTIAAFVEDANSLAVLWQCSVDFIQGHFLKEPSTELNYDFQEGF